MNLSLRARLLGVSIVAVCVIVLALVWETNITMRQQMLDQLLKDAQHFAGAYGEGVGQWLHDRQQAMTSLKKQIEDHPQDSPYAAILQTHNAAGFALTYYGNEQGQMFRQDPALDKNNASYDPRKRDWYQQALKENRAIVTAPYISATLKQLVVTLAEPVKASGAVIGAVGANLTLEQLTKRTNALDVPGKGYAILVDRSDQIITHPHTDLQTKSAGELSPLFDSSHLPQLISDNRLFETSLDQRERFVYAQAIPQTNWALIFVMDKATLMAPIYDLLITQIGIAVVLLALFTLALIYLFKVLFRNLERVAVALEDIAEGEGDLTVRIQVSSKDEIGRLAGGFNRFVERMQGIISRLHGTSVQLTGEADGVAGAAHNRSQRVQLQQDEIHMVATAVTEMAMATQEIAGNAERTASAAQDSVSLSHEGRVQVEKSQGSIRSLADEVEQATSTIAELNQHAQQISGILATISGIAEQTNLLALNAAIEAARAGEQGRGFAVVADEVRVLSQRTHASTAEIQTMIETLQQTTARAVTIMERGHRLARTSVGDADAAHQRLGQITEAISSIADMATQIASAAEEQTSVTNEINRNTEAIRGVASDMAEESEQAAAQARVLHQLARQVEQEVGRFRL
ncbi:chemotaxis protein [Pokkaliibacter plantistimulans]|uniref:Chemotaxis protein n=1 Tax=Pokkaliibacter plantistimulans TaxID=1635171 RepID=A0ABX5M283_9GAMM|nr:methyl-accepting chemotaxis protein [Pokkaliibacter plantistimulans]PXF31686.1 chemotaxis protein [Pokkaliibacter plantistimulans]